MIELIEAGEVNEIIVPDADACIVVGLQFSVFPNDLDPDTHLQAIKGAVYNLLGFIAEIENRGGWPLVITMPCCEQLVINSIQEIPADDVKCPCGKENHWLVKYNFGASND